MNSFIKYIAFSSIVLIMGCSVNAIIVDVNNVGNIVKRITLSDRGKNIEILHGNSLRIIKLKDIYELSIYSNSFKNSDNKMYYHARIILQDGEKIGFSNPGSNVESDTYINIDAVLKGKVNYREYKIKFSDIAQLEIKRD